MCEFILSDIQQEQILKVAYASNNTLEDGQTYYKYDGDADPQRDFCKKLLRLNKLYTKDEINLMSFRNENKGFGKGKGRGATPYSIFKYAGGKNCKHYWRAIQIRFDADGLPKEYDRGIASEIMNENTVIKSSPLQSIRSILNR